MKSSAHLIFSLAGVLSISNTSNAFVFPKRTAPTTTTATATANFRNVPTIRHVSNSDVTDIMPTTTEMTDEELATTYTSFTTLPRHPTNEEANEILTQTERALRSMQEKSLLFQSQQEEEEESNKNNNSNTNNNDNNNVNALVNEAMCDEIPLEVEQESVYANSYVDLGKVDTVGFDYDYTLVTYKKELLELIYDMALTRLVEEKEYPREMLEEEGMKFDPFFSIRGE